MNQTRRRPSRAVALAAIVGLAVVLAGVPAAPASAEGRSAGAEAGLALSSFLVTIPYGVGKMLWAVTGTLGAGMAWCFTGGDTDPAKKILDGAVRGDYVVTPDHLTGKDSLDFIGRSPENQAAQEQQQQQQTTEPGW